MGGQVVGEILVFLMISFCHYAEGQTTGNYWWHYANTPPPNTGDIRLVGGSRPSEGRVEVRVNGEWGTVCDDAFDRADAQIVCRQLGYYDGYRALPYSSAHYGQGSGPIWMDDLQCSGDEQCLLNCIDFRQLGQHNCGHSEDAGVNCLYYSYNYYAYFTTNSYYHTTSSYYKLHGCTTESYAAIPSTYYGPSTQLIIEPADVVAGVTSKLTLTCTPGLNDDIAEILLIQINHMVGGVKVPIADVTHDNAIQRHDTNNRGAVYGHVPLTGLTGAYLQVEMINPTDSDCGVWECTVSALDGNRLSIRYTAETTIHVIELSQLATEVGQLRREVEGLAANNSDLQSEIQNLEHTTGQGFSAFLVNNMTAEVGPLPLQRELTDTMGGFFHNILRAPCIGLYFLSLTISVSQGHDVTVELRHNYQTLLRLTAQGGSGSYGQESASVVAALGQDEAVEVIVVDFSPSALLLATPSTFLSVT